ncbi:MAG: DUF3883 domain-containing protein [Acidobacteria bacterium]|nr:DUF3883 domain-containing protein [Acidobacteriota bacterium]
MLKSVEKKAMALAESYLKNRGWCVEDVSRKRRHKGYDFLARKGRKKVKIEVKGCSHPWGDPRPHSTEFDEQKRLVADYLYVVYFIENERPKLVVIPRDAIKREYLTTKFSYCISSRFKKESVLRPYLKRI